jgi:hypothetical protein
MEEPPKQTSTVVTRDEASSEGCDGATARRGSTGCQNAYDTICATQSHFCKGQVVWAQLCGDGHKLHGDRSCTVALRGSPAGDAPAPRRWGSRRPAGAEGCRRRRWPSSIDSSKPRSVNAARGSTVRNLSQSIERSHRYAGSEGVIMNSVSITPLSQHYPTLLGCAVFCCLNFSLGNSLAVFQSFGDFGVLIFRYRERTSNLHFT